MRGIVCININYKTKKAGLPIKKKRERGYDEYDLDSEKAQSFIKEGKVTWYAVIYFFPNDNWGCSNSDELFRLEKRSDGWVAHHQYGDMLIGETFKTSDLKNVLKMEDRLRGVVKKAA